MMYVDGFALPADRTGDTGDSCVRAGIIVMCSQEGDPGRLGIYDIGIYEKSPGFFVRHPYHPVWSNENNWTRDQLLPLLGGLNTRIKQHKEYGGGPFLDIARRLFWSHFKRCFFTQSIDRDKRGSRKMLWPHSNWKDSNPTVDTFPMQWSWSELKFKPIIKIGIRYPDGSASEIEHRYFGDYRDILWPNHIGAMIITARLWYFCWFLPVSYLFHFLFLLLHSRSNHNEENQFIAESYIFGTLKIFTRMNPRWLDRSYYYWAERNELDYHDMLVSFIDREVTKYEKISSKKASS